MAKILLGNTSLSSGELDAMSKALLPDLCRSMAISFMEDEAGNLILEPPLGNRMIVLRPLPGPEQVLNLLLTTLSRELQGQGANVLIVPAAASDGQLFRLWQTQVLFAFSQNEASETAPGLRFFYAPGKKEESLGLIAALVRAMLSAGDPPAYTIPGTWEHFKNFRYRRILNNAGVPSVLIEFCRVDLNPAFVHHLSAWLVNGLVQYFQKPVDEATIIKLQPLLRHLQDSLALSGSPEGNPAGEARRKAGDLSARAGRAAIPAVDVAAPDVTAPADKAQRITPAPEDAGEIAAKDIAVKDTAAATPAGEHVAPEEVTARDRLAGDIAPGENTPGDVTVKGTAAGEVARECDTGKSTLNEEAKTYRTLPPEEKGITGVKTDALRALERSLAVPDEQEKVTASAVASGVKAALAAQSLVTTGQDQVTDIPPSSLTVSAKEPDQGPVTEPQSAPLPASPGISPLPGQQPDMASAAPALPPATSPKPIPVQTAAASPGPAAQAITTPGGTGLARPARHRHRSNSFAPPGDGPIFVFQRPPEIASFPSFFPQDVLERMLPAAVQSTFLTGQQVKAATPARPTWQAPLQKQPALPAQEPIGRPDTFMSQEPPALSLEPVAVNQGQAKPATRIPLNEDNDTALAELKRLSAAILAPEQLPEPPREPQNGEAPSI